MPREPGPVGFPGHQRHPLAVATGLRLPGREPGTKEPHGPAVPAASPGTGWPGRRNIAQPRQLGPAVDK
ncbi:protein of unknown function [Candidatus Hydrogenisulfobacillus filiaventi]|uniref:Uncharacterized protein n=1 Tax=Candidatus Hydrogenisulfobacillus filiaventi TaxID=2707344 RepID=A0A6F8ZFP1_9FIRM|nr:protein of unknown function [Candidatus Hydrogenisulfobacillus filiaventi]